MHGCYTYDVWCLIGGKSKISPFLIDISVLSLWDISTVLIRWLQSDTDFTIQIDEISIISF